MDIEFPQRLVDHKKFHSGWLQVKSEDGNLKKNTAKAPLGILWTFIPKLGNKNVPYRFGFNTLKKKQVSPFLRKKNGNRQEDGQLTIVKPSQLW